MHASTDTYLHVEKVHRNSYKSHSYCTTSLHGYEHSSKVKASRGLLVASEALLSASTGMYSKFSLHLMYGPYFRGKP